MYQAEGYHRAFVAQFILRAAEGHSCTPCSYWRTNLSGINLKLNQKMRKNKKGKIELSLPFRGAGVC